MDKIYYKELIEKYFDGNITDAEIKKLSDWIKNDRHLQNWWEEEFSKSDAGINPVLRDKLFARIKEQTQGKEETQGKENPRTIRMNPWKWAAAIVLPHLYCLLHLLSCRFFPNSGSALYSKS